jgi:hypothetical protein
MALLLPAATASAAGGASTKRTSIAAHPHRHAKTGRAAHARTRTLEPVALATTLAERYWGAVPCAGQVSIRTAQPLAAGLEAATDAWVTFESALGANNLLAPASSYSQCVISLAGWQWPTRTAMASDWNMFCLTVIHETGHLLGKPHSLAPGSVMASMFTDESSVPAICREHRAKVEAGADLLRG